MVGKGGTVSTGKSKIGNSPLSPTRPNKTGDSSSQTLTQTRNPITSERERERE